MVIRSSQDTCVFDFRSADNMNSQGVLYDNSSRYVLTVSLSYANSQERLQNSTFSQQVL